MGKGDAFNRQEVSSSYVTPESRYVASWIVGFADDEAESPEDAAGKLARLIRDGSVRVAVFDRQTGDTVEVDLPSEGGGDGA